MTETQNANWDDVLDTVCPHEDCPRPKTAGDKDCGSHEPWMT